jgi:uncharacterized membrane-anchored protein YitT (DUF2179 family)
VDKWLGKSYKEIGVDIFYETVGCGMMAVGVLMFLRPNHIAPGGVTGIATILNYLFNLPIGGISLFMNLPLLALGYRILGRVFTVRTLITLLINTLMFDYGVAIIPLYQGDQLLAAMFGGVLTGVGAGLIFMRGSTSGGTDIVVKITQRSLPHLSTGRIGLVINALVFAWAALVYGNIETALYGLVVTYVSGVVMDSIIYGVDEGKTVMVFSAKSEQIAQVIIERHNRGVTYIDGEGAYTRQPTRLLYCAVRRNEYPRLKKTIYQIDPDAFVIVSDATELLGKGFRVPVVE